MFKSYCAGDIAVAWAAPAAAALNLTAGLDKDTQLTMRRSSDVITTSEAANGEVGFIKSSSKMGEIELQYVSNAPNNAYLADVLNAMQNAKGDITATYVGDFFVYDPSGVVLAMGKNAILAAYPEIGTSAESPTPKTWKWIVESLEWTNRPTAVGTAISAGVNAAGSSAGGPVVFTF